LAVRDGANRKKNPRGDTGAATRLFFVEDAGCMDRTALGVLQILNYPKITTNENNEKIIYCGK
jgi:hypothetical protein